MFIMGFWVLIWKGKWEEFIGTKEENWMKEREISFSLPLAKLSGSFQFPFSPNLFAFVDVGFTAPWRVRIQFCFVSCECFISCMCFLLSTNVGCFMLGSILYTPRTTLPNQPLLLTILMGRHPGLAFFSWILECRL